MWWVITGAERFRVQYYDDPQGRFSRLMSYQQATSYAEIFGGQVCVDYNKVLKP